MQDKFLCILAQYDMETEQRLKELQQILSINGFNGTQTQNLPYHITLGTFKVSEKENLKVKIFKAAEQFKSFKVSLSSIGLFGLDVLFLAPSVNHELLNLQQFFSNEDNDGTWTAHTTLLIDKHDTILKALPYIAKDYKNIEAKIESISLYEFWPTQFITKEKLV
ncbi:2'-5' RNA ligase family protein [Anaerocolumna sp. AGMB13025]|uniref:2'-5' RNA ligase family protein n=1 Tax=Anaerocolumna sp. AGMB13025 TaxID=3039116 RepID=UPI00241EECB6|nr:2'-5' RNA ligase family protein [Anaerocolumna sp. AGMB13025]WFR59836.1 2'-5' RNA ligase family protein [Anaerocolumna sp. AGMB13025]